MNDEIKKYELINRQISLNDEISDIQKEIVVLLALLKKAEKEIGEIQTKLGKLEESEEVNLAYAS